MPKKQKNNHSSDELKETMKDPETASETAKDTKSNTEEVNETEQQQKEELSELEILQQELKGLKERYHRALADYQNLQRRSAKEILEARSRGVADFIKNLLPVIDTMEKAMEEVSNANIDKKVKDGLELFAFQFTDMLENAGLKEIPAVDKKFDPNFHEALCKRTDETKEDEIILTEFNRGYTFKGQVLRPSQVEINQR